MKYIINEYFFMKSYYQIQNKFSILMWMQIFASLVNEDIYQVLLLPSF